VSNENHVGRAEGDKAPIQRNELHSRKEAGSIETKELLHNSLLHVALEARRGTGKWWFLNQLVKTLGKATLGNYAGTKAQVNSPPPSHDANVIKPKPPSAPPPHLERQNDKARNQAQSARGTAFVQVPTPAFGGSIVCSKCVTCHASYGTQSS